MKEDSCDLKGRKTYDLLSRMARLHGRNLTLDKEKRHHPLT